MAQYRHPIDRDAFEIAIFCALSLESDPILALFDEHWEDTYSYGKALGDTNTYATGRIGSHNVVLVFMPGMGKSHAASVAASCRSSFRNIKLGLLAGICGGVPGGTNGHEEILLGDVIISTGVIQYDFGRQLSHQVVRKDTIHDQMGRPSPEIRGMLNKLMGAMGRAQLHSNIARYLKQLSLQRYDHLSYPGIGEDHLFEPAYSHRHHDRAECMTCSHDTDLAETACDAALELSCSDLECDANRLVPRRRLEAANLRASANPPSTMLLDWPPPISHFGLIASGDLVMKTAHRRDAIAKAENVIAFEMEGAGVWDQFPTIVIKGVCDYADSHKNKKWQKYAASTAAACVKSFLAEWRTHDSVRQPVSHAELSLEDNTTEATLSRRSTIHTAPFPLAGTNRPVHSPSLNVSSMEQRQHYLDSLGFNQIGTRQINIKNALAKTCTWLLDAPEYLKWLDDSLLLEHHGFLWIKGKPAAGKSTIMKFALQKIEKSMGGSIIISFFFNARGEDLEMTTLGMYRSLLFQLLEKVPDLQSLLDQLPAMGVDASSTPYVWDITKLQNLFESAIGSLGTRRLICFIDALDECGEDQIRDMVRFFEHLGQEAVSSPSGHRLLICFSSRHYPYITIGNSVQLVLEDQENHQQDISKYINSELKVKRNKLTEEIKADILKRASGIFLWVVLVVQILNRESDKGRLHLRALQQKLREIPDGLDKLFKSVLTKDNENMEELILCIRWVLYARQPLKCEELYHAILIGLDSTTVDKWDPEEIRQDEMERFILSSSKGLAEITKGRSRSVQFIHESVRDFLLKENGLDRLQQDLSLNFQGRSHEILKQCCNAYIEASINSLSLSSDELQVSSEDYPMLEYAVMNILWHADAAYGSKIRQDEFLNHFDLKLWIPRRNHFGRNKKGRAYTPKASPLYIYTCEELTNFIHDEVQRLPTMDVRGEYYSYPIFAAIHYKNERVLQTLLQPAATWPYQWRTSEEHDLSLTENARETVIRKLLRDGIDRSSSKRSTLFALAAGDGNIDLVKVLLKTGRVNVNAMGTSSYGTALLRAVAGGHYDVVKLLTDLAIVDMKCASQGPNGLVRAAASGSTEIVKLLLSIPACDPNGVRNYAPSRSPLYQAAYHGQKEVVQLLLADQRVLAQLNNNSSTDQPLSAAALLCRHINAPDVVRMLLDTGKVDPDLRNASGHTLFHEAVQRIRHTVDQGEKNELLKQGPNRATQRHVSILQPEDNGREVVDFDDASRSIVQLHADSEVVNESPLFESKIAEIRTGEPDVETIFENNLAPTDGQSLSCKSPELAQGAAYSATRTEIADLLLESGRVDPNSQTSVGKLTALHTAVITGNLAAIEYLLSIGVDPNLKDIEGRTPFHRAVENKADDLAELILACDQVNPDTKDSYGMTPMLSAACNGLDHTIKALVMMRHADIDAIDKDNTPTPIWAAAAGGCEHIVDLLSTTPLGKSTSEGQETVASYRRVMQHIEGREAYHASRISLQPWTPYMTTVEEDDHHFRAVLTATQLANKKAIRAEVDLLLSKVSVTHHPQLSGQTLDLPSFATSTVITHILKRKARRRLDGGEGGQSPVGDHALLDYQIQLILLEQQNKKRSMIERQPRFQGGQSSALEHAPQANQMQSLLQEQHDKKRQTMATQDENPSKRQEIIAPVDLTINCSHE